MNSNGGSADQVPKCTAGATIPAPWPLVTNGDFHRMRPGETLGYVPEVGDRIRYALRHTPWCPAQQRMLDGNDEQGTFGEIVTVTHVFEDENGTRYSCRDRRGERSSIDLDWWIVERVLEDGALW